MGTLRKNQPNDSSLAPESMIAARLGLTRVVCAALRRDHLKPQVDYVIERKRVMITEAGYVALRGLLGCPESPDEQKARLSHCVREPEPQSQLGPIDPQIPGIGRTISARAVVDQFDKAKSDIIADRGLAAVWASILQALGPALLTEAKRPGI
jgi:hypothetical protein